MTFKDIPKILYSPVKAFAEISKKPKWLIPVLILIFIVLVGLGTQYVSISKQFVEKGIPEKDEWTEPSALGANPMWASNGTLEADRDDKYVGNSSIKSTVLGSTVWIRINLTATVNSSEYDTLFFRVKWLRENNAFPNQGVTLKVLSGDGDYFLFDLAQKISATDNTWANITLNIGPESTDWTKINSPSWDTINALEFMLKWAENANSTIKIDDVYFGGNYIPYLSVYASANWVFVFATTIMSYVLRWIIIFGVILITFKVLRFEQSSGKTLFATLGYAFTIELVYQAVLFFLLLSLPTVSFPLRLWVPVANSEVLRTELAINAYQSWYDHIAWQISPYVLILFQLWFAISVAAILRSMYNFSWSRSIVIATFSAFLGLFLATIFISLYALV